MRWVLIFLVFWFFSCTNTVEQPENLIPKDKMAEIISDIYLHQQSSYLIEIKHNPPDFATIDASIIEKHGTTIKDFEDSYRFYVLSPEEYNKLLITVRTNLEQKLPEQERLQREEERKKNEAAKK